MNQRARTADIARPGLIQKRCLPVRSRAPAGPQCDRIRRCGCVIGIKDVSDTARSCGMTWFFTYLFGPFVLELNRDDP
jgi:hypothetical protein